MAFTGSAGVVLDAGEPLLLGGGDDDSVGDQGGGGVVVEAADPQDVHGRQATSSVAGIPCRRNDRGRPAVQYAAWRSRSLGDQERGGGGMRGRAWRGVVPVVVPVAVGSVALIAGHGIRAIVAFGVGGVVGVLVLLGVPIERWVGRAASFVADAVSVVASLVVGASLVAVGGGLRLVRDVLRGGRLGTAQRSTWTGTSSAASVRLAERTFAMESAGMGAGPGRRPLAGVRSRWARRCSCSPPTWGWGWVGRPLRARNRRRVPSSTP